MTTPAIIMVRPQLGENIGKAARAMLNFGLTDMRLVEPRDGWPNPMAGPAASGADIVLEQAQVFATTGDAIADLQHVYAATIRSRELPKPVVTAEEAAKLMRAATGHGERAGVLFGPERSGLTNDDLVLADKVLTVPVNPQFGSLNIAQAVILVAYEWFRTGDETPAMQMPADQETASKADIEGLYRHFAEELEKRNYFRPPARRAVMKLALRNILENGGLSEQETRTLRGVVKALSQPPRTKD